MTFALFVSQYLYSEISVARFPETSELACFRGAFLMLQMPEISVEICRSLSSRVCGQEAEQRTTERPMQAR